MTALNAQQSETLGAVVCLGVFDGVHRGHRELIAVARRLGASMNLPVTVMTFDPHPMEIIRPGHAPLMLTDLAERKLLLLEAGADNVYVLSFNKEVAEMTPRDFVERVVVNQLHARAVVVGENFWFGHCASGDVRVLANLGSEFGFEVHPVDIARDGTHEWSSTKVRGLVTAGEITGANEILGRPYRLSGVVVHGDARGRDLGYPTANIDVNQRRVIPADGVYAGWASVPGELRMPAAISVGTNPQFNGRDRRVEAYVIGQQDLDLYDTLLSLEFVARVRGQLVFEDLDGLLKAMASDVRECRTLLEGAEHVLISRPDV